MVGFVSRLSATSLSQATGAAESWIQVAVAGDFEDPGRYGSFSITADDLATMASNFAAGKYPEPPTEICVDYDHLTLKVKAPGDGKAAGWFRELQTRADGDELWARIEWTEAGAEAIRAKEYRYFSPVIRWGYTSHKGEDLGAVLFNGAVTNTPFLQGMEPLALSAGASGRGRVCVLATLTDGDKRARLDEAVRHRFGTYGDDYGCWLVDTIDGATAIFWRDGAYHRVGYAIGADGTIAFLGDPLEVVIQYAPLSGALGGTSLMAKTITLTSAAGTPVQIDAEQLESLDLVRELRSKLPKEGEIAVSTESLTALQANVTDLGTKVTALSTQLTEETTKRQAVEATLSLKTSTDAVDALVRAGKATPAERDSLIKLHQKDTELFTSLTGTRAQVVPLKSPVGADGGGAAETSAEGQLQVKAAALRAAHPTLSPEKAFTLACDQHPALYAQSEREAGRR